MAPKRKAAAAPVPLVSLSPRRTRSGAVGKRVVPPAAAAAPAKAKKKIRFAAEVEVEEKDKDKEKEKEKEKEEEKEKEKEKGANNNKSIVIEACKQCNAFKTRALKVKEGLESAVPGVAVTINPQKPRRGCFEIREEGGEIFISLLNMPRPFTPMKKLDMDEVIQDIVKKIA